MNLNNPIKLPLFQWPLLSTTMYNSYSCMYIHNTHNPNVPPITFRIIDILNTPTLYRLGTHFFEPICKYLSTCKHGSCLFQQWCVMKSHLICKFVYTVFRVSLIHKQHTFITLCQLLATHLCIKITMSSLILTVQ